MISCDTNILFPACDSHAPHHHKARDFLQEYSEREDFCLCEQVLMELYVLLRNPKVCNQPLSASEAVDIIQRFRSNPNWAVVDVMQSPNIMTDVWAGASNSSFPYRRIFDLRLGLTLRQHGVKEFATRNLRDFQQIGFERVWDPFA